MRQSVALVVKFFIDIRYSVKLWNLGMALIWCKECIKFLTVSLELRLEAGDCLHKFSLDFVFGKAGNRCVRV